MVVEEKVVVAAEKVAGVAKEKGVAMAEAEAEVKSQVWVWVWASA